MGLPRQAAGQEVAHRAGHVLGDGPQATLAMRGPQLCYAASAHDTLPRQHFVQDAAQRVHIGIDPQRFACPLFRCHVERCANDTACQVRPPQQLRTCLVLQISAFILEHGDQPEIGHPQVVNFRTGQLIRPHQDVLRFQVAVHKAGQLLGGVRQAARDLQSKEQSRLQRQGLSQPTA